MNNKKRENIKLQIEKLKENKNYIEFEVSEINNYFINILAILVTIVVTVELTLKQRHYQIFVLILFFALSIYTRKKLDVTPKTIEIRKIYSKINELYEQLLK